jgi:hypothetical protein
MFESVRDVLDVKIEDVRDVTCSCKVVDAALHPWLALAEAAHTFK